MGFKEQDNLRIHYRGRLGLCGQCLNKQLSNLHVLVQLLQFWLGCLILDCFLVYRYWSLVKVQMIMNHTVLLPVDRGCIVLPDFFLASIVHVFDNWNNFMLNHMGISSTIDTSSSSKLNSSLLTTILQNIFCNRDSIRLGAIQPIGQDSFEYGNAVIMAEKPISKN